MNILVIAAHPNLENSRANRALLDAIQGLENVHIHDLYKEYPDWHIDVNREQELLLGYERIVFQFPFYWYSCTPLLKKWFDDVLVPGWAFGPDGNHLKDKEFMVATTVGSSENGYRAGGDNWFTVSELLRPIQATMTRCKGKFLPPYAMHNADRLTPQQFREQAARYAEYIQAGVKQLVH